MRKYQNDELGGLTPFLFPFSRFTHTNYAGRPKVLRL